MQVWDKAGIHFGFLQPWSQILGWHQYNQPWFLPEETYAIFKDYARLRYRLIPYLYSAAHAAARTGMPMMRPMPLVAPDDPKSDEFILQYMLGDAFLTCAFTGTIYLPEGHWIDYWTGEVHDGPKEIQYKPPADRGGPLFVRAGAIIPTWPEMDCVGHRSVETMGLEVFPGGTSCFTLCEDDGLTEAYLDGEVAMTEITCEADADGVTLTIPPRAGSYDGMPERRVWDIVMHLPASPESVELDGSAVDAWDYDREAGLVQVSVTEGPNQAADLRVTR
jgi:alpha-glucosidase (family GH31 glycosyl hydrolase)